MPSKNPPSQVLRPENPGESAPAKSDNQLRAQLAEIYGLPASATEQDILKVAADEKTRRQQEAADEKIIEQKMKAGLTRDQAIAVIGRQRTHDEVVARERNTRLPLLLEIIGKHKADLRAARRVAREDFPSMDGSEWQAALDEFNKTQPTE